MMVIVRLRRGNDADLVRDQAEEEVELRLKHGVGSWRRCSWSTCFVAGEATVVGMWAREAGQSHSDMVCFVAVLRVPAVCFWPVQRVSVLMFCVTCTQWKIAGGFTVSCSSSTRACFGILEPGEASPRARPTATCVGCSARLVFFRHVSCRRAVCVALELFARTVIVFDFRD